MAFVLLFYTKESEGRFWKRIYRIQEEIALELLKLGAYDSVNDALASGREQVQFQER